MTWLFSSELGDTTFRSEQNDFLINWLTAYGTLLHAITAHLASSMTAQEDQVLSPIHTDGTLSLEKENSRRINENIGVATAGFKLTRDYTVHNNIRRNNATKEVHMTVKRCI